MRVHIYNKIEGVVLGKSLDVDLVVTDVDLSIPDFVPTNRSVNSLSTNTDKFPSPAQLDKTSKFTKLSASYDAKKVELHGEAETAYDDANSEYLEADNHVYPYIKINSAVRSTVNQYHLYRKFIEHKDFGGEYSAPANQPGSSNHEYGLAIDIFRKEDEYLLKKCLENNGWKQHSNTSEPWHYDATGIPGYSDIQSKIAKVKSAYSLPIVTALYERLNAEKTLDKDLPAYKVTRENIEKRSVSLKAFKQHLKTTQTSLKTRRQKLSDKANDFTIEIEKLKEQKRKISKFKYSYCPNGNAYSACAHLDQKRRYTEERNVLISAYNKTTIKLEKTRVYLVEEKSNLAADVKAFIVENSRLNSEVTRLRADIEKLAKFKTQLEKLQGVVDDFEDGIDEMLQTLSLKVAEIRNGNYNSV